MKLYSNILLTWLCSLFCMVSTEAASVGRKPIVVLYDNDVHCSMDGYTRIAGLRNAINATDTARCIIVSSGDFIQGGAWGAISAGEYIIDVMNSVGYSAVTLGNHEFDYSIPTQFKLFQRLNAPVTCANMTDTITGRDAYNRFVMCNIPSGENQQGAEDVTRIAFVGCVTPTTEEMEKYAFQGQPYTLYTDRVYSRVQQAVNQARACGADYVIVLSHLGEKDSPETSLDLIHATHGIDCVLDGHTHFIEPDTLVANDMGQLVPLTQTGTLFRNIGKLYIPAHGRLQTMLLPTEKVPYSDSRVTAVYDSINNITKEMFAKKIGFSKHALHVLDATDEFFIRNQEGAIGDLAADAIAIETDSDIGVENAGGIRKGLPAGDLTHKMIVECLPYFNNAVKKLVPGSAIVKLLEKSFSCLPKRYGEFLQVSGIKCTVHVSADGDANGTHRVTVNDVMVLDRKTGQYSPIDLNRNYTIGMGYYIPIAFSDILDDYPFVTIVSSTDTELLERYIRDTLHGTIGDEYSAPQGRITISYESTLKSFRGF